MASKDVISTTSVYHLDATIREWNNETSLLRFRKKVETTRIFLFIEKRLFFIFVLTPGKQTKERKKEKREKMI